MPSAFGVVADAAERPTDDLLAQELRPEGADAEDVGDGVGVPALGQHRDRDDAADVLAEPARLADRVHDLAQEVLVGELVGAAAREAGAYSRLNSSISAAAAFLNAGSSASPDSSWAESTRSVFGRSSQSAVLARC